MIAQCGDLLEFCLNYLSTMRENHVSHEKSVTTIIETLIEMRKVKSQLIVEKRTIILDVLNGFFVDFLDGADNTVIVINIL